MHYRIILIDINKLKAGTRFVRILEEYFFGEQIKLFSYKNSFEGK
jgi:hypothetical protein